MRWLQRFSGSAALLALLLSVPAVASAQDTPKAKPVEFNTVDGVEIKGTFYPSGGKVGATVMLLHALGEHSRKAEYVSLAKALQKAGYGVLTFDFRGHGESTHVKPGIPNVNPMLAVKGFWDVKANREGVSGWANNKPLPSEIENKQFHPAYMRILVNDIAAAKTYLDQLNDAGECNSGAVILIGAKEGATLGAVWMNSEWHRYKMLMPQPGFAGGLDLQNPEGQNIAAAVWLSITNKRSPKTGGQTVNVPATLEVPGKVRMVPMAFFYGEGDTAGEKVALSSEKFLKADKKNYQFTGALKLPGANRASGSGLLSKSLDTEKEIVTYLNNALEGKTWINKSRSGSTDSYYWQIVYNNQLQRVLARPAGLQNIQFATYVYFAK